MELFCGLFCVVGIVVVIVAAVRSGKAKPTTSEAAAAGDLSGTIVAKFPGTCAACGLDFAAGARIYWKKGGSTRHYDCVAARNDGEQQAFARIMDKLDAARGPGARRNLLKEAEAKIQDSELRKRLVLEASRLDVEGVLEKVATLKTPAAKKRRIEEALNTIRNDSIADDLQVEQIGMLEAELRKLESGSS